MASREVLYLEDKAGNVDSISCYFAGGDMPGYIVPVSRDTLVGPTSPRGFKVQGPHVIKYMTGPAKGVLQVLADGEVTPIRLDLASILAKPGARWGNLAGGTREYSLVVEQVMS